MPDAEPKIDPLRIAEIVAEYHALAKETSAAEAAKVIRQRYGLTDVEIRQLERK